MNTGIFYSIVASVLFSLLPAYLQLFHLLLSPLFLEEYPEYQRNSDSDSSKVEEIKLLISQNSQMKENQNQHDDKFGYGILRIDLLIESVDNSSNENLITKNYKPKDDVRINIFDIFQTERRMTANVPPDNSANAIE